MLKVSLWGTHFRIHNQASVPYSDNILLIKQRQAWPCDIPDKQATEHLESNRTGLWQHKWPVKAKCHELCDHNKFKGAFPLLQPTPLRPSPLSNQMTKKKKGNPFSMIDYLFQKLDIKNALSRFTWKQIHISSAYAHIRLHKNYALTLSNNRLKIGNFKTNTSTHITLSLKLTKLQKKSNMLFIIQSPLTKKKSSEKIHQIQKPK